jgi:multicomponent Na+:H+ antiporter subunit G
MRVVSDLLIVAGSAWCVLAAAGILRFDDIYARLHAGTKATTLGLALVVVGAALRLDPGTAAKLVLAGLLAFLTAPVGAHLVGRAVHQVPGATKIRIDTIDELDGNTGEGAGQPPDSDRGDDA